MLFRRAELGYILVLFAMRLAPVSRVAPMREMSMIVGMYFGARLLKGGQTLRRVLGSLCIAIGVGVLALGGLSRIGDEAQSDKSQLQ